jgi:hypothetical protein
MPSFMTKRSEERSEKRSKLVTATVAGTLAVATVATAAALTLPSASAASSAGTADAHLMALTSSQQVSRAVHGDALTSAQRIVGFEHVRFSLGERQLQHDLAVAKAKAAQVAKAKAAQVAKAKAAQVAKAKAAAARAATVKAAKAAAKLTTGTPQQIAQAMLTGYGWSGSQFPYLYQLWFHESGWNPNAQNLSSGAYGIPQALPGSQMASAGSDWRTNPATQIKWGLNYIQSRYGSPAGAWAHELANNWY